MQRGSPDVFLPLAPRVRPAEPPQNHPRWPAVSHQTNSLHRWRLISVRPNTQRWKASQDKSNSDYSFGVAYSIVAGRRRWYCTRRDPPATITLQWHQHQIPLTTHTLYWQSLCHHKTSGTNNAARDDHHLLGAAPAVEKHFLFRPGGALSRSHNVDTATVFRLTKAVMDSEKTVAATTSRRSLPRCQTQ